MRMSPYRLNGNVPIGAGWLRSFCSARGDIDDESQRTGPNEDHGGGESQRTQPGAGGRVDEHELPASQAALAPLPGPRGCQSGASATWQTWNAVQACCVAHEGAQALRPGLLRGFRSDLAGRGTAKGRDRGGSRYDTAIVVGDRQAHGAAAAPATPAQAAQGTRACPWPRSSEMAKRLLRRAWVNLLSLNPSTSGQCSP